MHKTSCIVSCNVGIWTKHRQGCDSAGSEVLGDWGLYGISEKVVDAGSPTSHLEAAQRTQSTHGSGASGSGALQESESAAGAAEDGAALVTEVTC